MAPSTHVTPEENLTQSEQSSGVATPLKEVLAPENHSAASQSTAERVADQRQEQSLYASEWGPALAQGAIKIAKGESSASRAALQSQTDAQEGLQSGSKKKKKSSSGDLNEVTLRSLVATFGPDAAVTVANAIERFTKEASSTTQISSTALQQLVKDLAAVLEPQLATSKLHTFVESVEHKASSGVLTSKDIVDALEVVFLGETQPVVSVTANLTPAEQKENALENKIALSNVFERERFTTLKKTLEALGQGKQENQKQLFSFLSENSDQAIDEASILGAAKSQYPGVRATSLKELHNSFAKIENITDPEEFLRELQTLKGHSPISAELSGHERITAIAQLREEISSISEILKALEEIDHSRVTVQKSLSSLSQEVLTSSPTDLEIIAQSYLHSLRERVVAAPSDSELRLELDRIEWDETLRQIKNARTQDPSDTAATSSLITQYLQSSVRSDVHAKNAEVTLALIESTVRYVETIKNRASISKETITTLNDTLVANGENLKGAKADLSEWHWSKLGWRENAETKKAIENLENEQRDLRRELERSRKEYETLSPLLSNTSNLAGQLDAILDGKKPSVPEFSQHLLKEITSGSIKNDNPLFQVGESYNRFLTASRLVGNGLDHQSGETPALLRPSGEMVVASKIYQGFRSGNQDEQQKTFKAALTHLSSANAQSGAQVSQACRELFGVSLSGLLIKEIGAGTVSLSQDEFELVVSSASTSELRNILGVGVFIPADTGSRTDLLLKKFSELSSTSTYEGIDQFIDPLVREKAALNQLYVQALTQKEPNHAAQVRLKLYEANKTLAESLSSRSAPEREIVYQRLNSRTASDAPVVLNRVSQCANELAKDITSAQTSTRAERIIREANFSAAETALLQKIYQGYALEQNSKTAEVKGTQKQILTGDLVKDVSSKSADKESISLLLKGGREALTQYDLNALKSSPSAAASHDQSIKAAAALVELNKSGHLQSFISKNGDNLLGAQSALAQGTLASRYLAALNARDVQTEKNIELLVSSKFIGGDPGAALTELRNHPSPHTLGELYETATGKKLSTILSAGDPDLTTVFDLYVSRESSTASERIKAASLLVEKGLQGGSDKSIDLELIQQGYALAQSEGERNELTKLVVARLPKSDPKDVSPGSSSSDALLHFIAQKSGNSSATDLQAMKLILSGTVLSSDMLLGLKQYKELDTQLASRIDSHEKVLKQARDIFTSTVQQTNSSDHDVSTRILFGISAAKELNAEHHRFLDSQKSLLAGQIAGIAALKSSQLKMQRLVSRELSQVGTSEVVQVGGGLQSALRGEYYSALVRDSHVEWSAVRSVDYARFTKAQAVLGAQIASIDWWYGVAQTTAIIAASIAISFVFSPAVGLAFAFAVNGADKGYRMWARGLSADQAGREFLFQGTIDILTIGLLKGVNVGKLLERLPFARNISITFTKLDSNGIAKQVTEVVKVRGSVKEINKFIGRYHIDEAIFYSKNGISKVGSDIVKAVHGRLTALDNLTGQALVTLEKARRVSASGAGFGGFFTLPKSEQPNRYTIPLKYEAPFNTGALEPFGQQTPLRIENPVLAISEQSSPIISDFPLAQQQQQLIPTQLPPSLERYFTQIQVDNIIRETGAVRDAVEDALQAYLSSLGSGLAAMFPSQKDTPPVSPPPFMPPPGDTPGNGGVGTLAKGDAKDPPSDQPPGLRPSFDNQGTGNSLTRAEAGLTHHLNDLTKDPQPVTTVRTPDEFQRLLTIADGVIAPSEITQPNQVQLRQASDRQHQVEKEFVRLAALNSETLLKPDRLEFTHPGQTSFVLNGNTQSTIRSAAHQDATPAKLQHELSLQESMNLERKELMRATLANVEPIPQLNKVSIAHGYSTEIKDQNSNREALSNSSSLATAHSSQDRVAALQQSIVNSTAVADSLKINVTDSQKNSAAALQAHRVIDSSATLISTKQASLFSSNVLSEALTQPQQSTSSAVAIEKGTRKSEELGELRSVALQEAKLTPNSGSKFDKRVAGQVEIRSDVAESRAARGNRLSANSASQSVNTQSLITPDSAEVSAKSNVESIPHDFSVHDQVQTSAQVVTPEATTELLSESAPQPKRTKKQRQAEARALRDSIIQQLLTKQFNQAQRLKLLGMLQRLGISEIEYRELVGKLGHAEVESLAAATHEEGFVDTREALEVEQRVDSEDSLSEPAALPEKMNDTKISRAELFRKLQAEKQI